MTISGGPLCKLCGQYIKEAAHFATEDDWELVRHRPHSGRPADSKGPPGARVQPPERPLLKKWGSCECKWLVCNILTCACPWYHQHLHLLPWKRSCLSVASESSQRRIHPIHAASADVFTTFLHHCVAPEETPSDSRGPCPRGRSSSLDGSKRLVGDADRDRRHQCSRAAKTA